MPGSQTRWRAGTVRVAGGQLAYHRTGGPGPPLVLAHGLTDNGLCWSRLAQALAFEFDVVMLDARGHGESSPIASVVAHDPGQDIAEAIAALDLAAPVVIGHSVGARAAAACAAMHPDRVSKLILEDPPLQPRADAATTARRRLRFRDEIARVRAMSDADLTAMGRAAAPRWSEEEFPAWTSAKKQVDPDAMPDYRTPWQETLAAIAAPTLLICGDPALGALVTPNLAREAGAINPRIRVVVIAQAGHNIRRENFAEYLSAVRAFL